MPDLADENLRQENRNNEHELQVTCDAAAIEETNLIEVLEFLQARTEKKSYGIKDINQVLLAVRSVDARWRTATATGSLNFVEYDRVQQFAGAYQVREILRGLHPQALDNYLQLEAYVLYGFNADKMTPEDIKRLYRMCEELFPRVCTRPGGGKLELIYEKALNGKWSSDDLAKGLPVCQRVAILLVRMCILFKVNYALAAGTALCGVSPRVISA